MAEANGMKTNSKNFLLREQLLRFVFHGHVIEGFFDNDLICPEFLHSLGRQLSMEGAKSLSVRGPLIGVSSTD